MSVQLSRFNDWSWDVIGAGGIRLATITQGEHPSNYYVSAGDMDWEHFATFEEAVAYASGR